MKYYQFYFIAILPCARESTRCGLSGIDASGIEGLSKLDDQIIRCFVNSRMVRRYLEKALVDYPGNIILRDTAKTVIVTASVDYFGS